MLKGVSVIVCYYNGFLRLTETLQSIVDQVIEEGIAWEIVIVDNNSNDKSQEIIDKFKKDYDAKIAFHYTREPTAGLSFARKKGIESSKYEYILFCDDDNLLEKKYVSIAYKLIEQNSNIGMLGGMGVMSPKQALPIWFKSVETAYAVGSQFFKDGDITHAKGYVWGAGMVMRRTAWLKVIQSGFKEFLLTGRKSTSKALAGEDTEMCILLQNAGYEIHYSALLQFVHAIPSTRLTWNYYKSICKGFSIAQVFLENYLYYFNEHEPAKFSRTLSASFNEDLRIFFEGCLTINFYKLLFLEFVKKQPGYTLGFHKRKYFDRIIGRIIYAKDLRRARNQIITIKKENLVSIL